MTEKSMKQASLAELKAMKARGEIQSPSAATASADLPADFWDTAELVDHRTKKVPVNMRIDSDIVEFFKSDGKGHLTRMHQVLRSYVEAQKSR
ncbi:MAG: BrnA antitoxin family protein [Pseudomonadota bacterium]